MRAPRFALSAVLVASALIHPLSAQAPGAGKTKSIGFTGGAAVTYGNLTGGDFDGTKAGAGFDLNAGITRGAWQLGLGYDRMNHGHEDSNGDFVVSNLYLEPRFQFASATRRITPYIAARVSSSRRRTASSGSTLAPRASRHRCSGVTARRVNRMARLRR